MRPSTRRRILVGAVVLLQLGTVGLLYLSLEATPQGSGARDFYTVLAGAVLTLIGTSLLRWANERNEYKRGAYTERAKAVQAILALVRIYKDVGAWADEEPDDPLTKMRKEIGDFPSALPAEWKVLTSLSAARDKVLQAAFHHDIWIGARGVKAVRAFLDDVSFDNLKALGSRDERVTRLNAAQSQLQRELCRDLGFEPQ